MIILIAPVWGYFYLLPKSIDLTGKFTFGRNERLKSRKRIQQVFTEGKKLTVDSLRVSWMEQKNLIPPTLQFGVGVSTRNFRKAVDRNRIKRLIKESWRLQKNNLSEIVSANSIGLYVFVIFTGKEIPDFLAISDMMNKAIDKLSNALKK